MNDRANECVWEQFLTNTPEVALEPVAPRTISDASSVGRPQATNALSPAAFRSVLACVCAFLQNREVNGNAVYGANTMALGLYWAES